MADHLTDVVVVGSANPEQLSALAATLPSGSGWHPLACPEGWRAVASRIGGGGGREALPLVVEGWPTLERWGGTARKGHQRLAEAAAREAWRAVPGDVSYVHLGAGGRAAFVRAPAARAPFYVDARDGLRVATRMELLLRLRPEWPWRLDPFVAFCWVAAHGAYPPGRTPIQEVEAVRTGHVLRVEDFGERVRAPQRYWDPRPQAPPRRFDAREHSEALRALVLRSLETELDPGGGNLLKLSLGTDSSTLAVLTKRTLGIDYEAISYLPANATDRATEEDYRSILSAAAPPRRHVRRHLDDDAWIELLGGVTRGGLPVVDPSLFDVLGHHTGVRALYGGEWADAACGDRITVADWLAEAPYGSLLRHSHRLEVGEKELLRTMASRLTGRLPLHRQVPAPWVDPEMVRPEILEEARTWSAELVRRTRRGPARRARLWHELDVDLWLLQNWEVLSALGIRRVTPFYRREIIEWAFAAPVGELIGPTMKKPLRRAFARDVPAPLLWRDKGLWPNEPPARSKRWPRDLPPELSPILREDWFPRPTESLQSVARSVLASLEGYVLRLRNLKTGTRQG